MNWDRYGDVFLTALGQTVYMVTWTMLLGGLFGLIIGIGLYVTRRGNLQGNRGVFIGLNALVNIVRPIPFLIFVTAIYPLTNLVVGKTIGTEPATFAMIIMATFAFSRLVEQNLVALDPGVIEAARAMGAGPLRIIATVLVPEALAPLILGYTFLFVGVIDMSAVVGAIGGGGIGAFALDYGYKKYDWPLTFFVVVVIILIVQAAQVLGNTLARRALHR